MQIILTLVGWTYPLSLYYCIFIMALLILGIQQARWDLPTWFQYRIKRTISVDSKIPKEFAGWSTYHLKNDAHRLSLYFGIVNQRDNLIKTFRRFSPTTEQSHNYTFVCGIVWVNRPWVPFTKKLTLILPLMNNYIQLFIHSKLQPCSRWSLGMNKLYYPTL